MCTCCCCCQQEVAPTDVELETRRTRVRELSVQASASEFQVHQVPMLGALYLLRGRTIRCAALLLLSTGRGLPEPFHMLFRATQYYVCDATVLLLSRRLSQHQGPASLVLMDLLMLELHAAAPFDPAGGSSGLRLRATEEFTRRVHEL
ncbi:unnamed protein product [Symbiodinium natans]|uniref:Uncharacterized protein n=1 Tax=Symbiodinium natans TaxID=878477 RepID=A0A812TMX9_9DINO|nr:unnamed protein product [Symbiodinium natans]